MKIKKKDDRIKDLEEKVQKLESLPWFNENINNSLSNDDKRFSFSSEKRTDDSIFSQRISTNLSEFKNHISDAKTTDCNDNSRLFSPMPRKKLKIEQQYDN